MLEAKLSDISKIMILCYIDPGLGSMLVQVFISAVIGAAFFFRRTIGNAISWIKARLFKRQKSIKDA